VLDYDPTFPWSVNIDDLASKLESVLRERTKTRATILPYPNTNIPALVQENEDALANFDKATEVIQYQASAAREGSLWFDPETLRVPSVALDDRTMTWRREAQKRGKLVSPAEYYKSRHSATHTPPLLVRRGSGPVQAGAPAS
jgi:hypothetical protein